MAALLMAGMTMGSCSEEDNAVTGVQDVVPATAQYTMTVSATKGNPQTRALALDTEGNITSTWTAGDEVKVYRGDDLLGTLQADGNGAKTTLTGSLNTAPAAGDALTLQYLSPTYGTQDGTLTGSDHSIDKVCDYATASVTVSTVDDQAKTITTTAGAQFQNQQAIVKFTLKKSGDEALIATQLTLTADGKETYTVSPASAASELYVALPALDNRPLLLTASDGTNSYVYNRSAATFAASKFYPVSVTMTKQTVYALSGITAATTIPNGAILTGTLSGNHKISIADGATVTLRDAHINGSHNDNTAFAGLTCLGDATLILEGESTVCSFHVDHPGIYVPEEKTFTITGTGKLNASCTTANISAPGAGIGGGLNLSCGNIVIQSGTVTATGGNAGAGIGCGHAFSQGADATSQCGDITISGGTVTATGGNDAAGIGSGYAFSAWADATSQCGNITISGGTVWAVAGSNAQAIGKGKADTSQEHTATSTTGTITKSPSASITEKSGGTISYTLKFKNGSSEVSLTAGTVTITAGDFSTTVSPTSTSCKLPVGNYNSITISCTGAKFVDSDDYLHIGATFSGSKSSVNVSSGGTTNLGEIVLTMEDGGTVTDNKGTITFKLIFYDQDGGPAIGLKSEKTVNVSDGTHNYSFSYQEGVKSLRVEPVNNKKFTFTCNFSIIKVYKCEVENVTVTGGETTDLGELNMMKQ